MSFLCCFFFLYLTYVSCGANLFKNVFLYLFYEMIFVCKPHYLNAHVCQLNRAKISIVVLITVAFISCILFILRAKQIAYELNVAHRTINVYLSMMSHINTQNDIRQVLFFFAIASYFPSTVHVQYLVGMWCNFCVKSHAPLGLFASTALFLYPYLFWFRIRHRVFALIISALRID